MATKRTNNKTKEVILKAIPGTRGILVNVAVKCGLNRNTIALYAKEYEEVREALQDERERLIDMAENNLVVALKDKEAWATVYALKTLGKSRGYVEKQEIESKNDTRIRFEWGDDDSDDSTP